MRDSSKASLGALESMFLFPKEFEEVRKSGGFCSWDFLRFLPIGQGSLSAHAERSGAQKETDLKKKQKQKT